MQTWGSGSCACSKDRSIGPWKNWANISIAGLCVALVIRVWNSADRATG